MRGAADRRQDAGAARAAAPAARSVPDDPSRHLTALAALGDGQLGSIRGGFDTGTGAELRFAFQQATYVNGNLAQSLVLPTITVAGNVTQGGFVPSSAATAEASSAPLPPPNAGQPTNAGAQVLFLTAGGTTQPNVSAPFVAVGRPSFSWVNLARGSDQAGIAVPTTATLGDTGATSILTTVGGGGLTNLVGNTANGQLVQQVTRLDLSANGLGGLLQAGVRSPVVDNLRSLSTLPR